MKYQTLCYVIMLCFCLPSSKAIYNRLELNNFEERFTSLEETIKNFMKTTSNQLEKLENKVNKLRVSPTEMDKQNFSSSDEAEEVESNENVSENDEINSKENHSQPEIYGKILNNKSEISEISNMKSEVFLLVGLPNKLKELEDRMTTSINNLQSSSSKEFEKLNAKIDYQQNVHECSGTNADANQFQIELYNKLLVSLEKENPASPNVRLQLEKLNRKINSMSSKIDLHSKSCENSVVNELFQKILHNIQKDVSDLKLASGKKAEAKIYFEDNFNSSSCLKWKNSSFIEKVLEDSETTEVLSGLAKFRKTLISNDPIVVQFSAILKGKESCGWIGVSIRGCNIQDSLYYPQIFFSKIFGNTFCNQEERGAEFNLDNDDSTTTVSKPDTSIFAWESGISTATFVLTPNNVITMKINNQVVYTGIIAKSLQPDSEICGLTIKVAKKEHSIELLHILFTNSEAEAEKRYQQISASYK